MHGSSKNNKGARMSNDEPLPFDRPMPGDPQPAFSDVDRDFASDSLKRLISQAERRALPWRPVDRGDMVAGKVIDISEAESDFNKDESVPLVTIETPSDALWQVFGWHTVLRRELNRKIKKGIIVVGGEVAIVYLGPDPNAATSGRNPTELYQVYAEAPVSKVR
jgi:hypothetical protein